MSQKGMIIEERSEDLGNFIVGRLLPFREKRMVGPFIFIDHMGPNELGPDHYFNVDQHPHIGLCTLTYLLEGQILHEDSAGHKQIVLSGEVGLMVAGSGVSHTERVPTDLLGKTFTMHGYQIWIALPKKNEGMNPEFFHVSEEMIPRKTIGGIELRMLSGEALKMKSRLPIYSPHFLIEVRSTKKQALGFVNELSGEVAILVNQGSVWAEDKEVSSGKLLIVKEGRACNLQIEDESVAFILGGTPFEEGRIIDWNFVASTMEIIEKARVSWDSSTFPMIPGEQSYIPRPQINFKLKPRR